MIDSMRYELAATTFVFNGSRFAIHKHPKIGKLLPPGGHVETNELPHEAAVREVLEETGLSPRLVLPDSSDLGIQSVPLPIAILVEKIDEKHSHVDMIYVATTATEDLHEPFFWATVEEAAKLGASEDVVRLAKKGLEIIIGI